MKTESNIKSLSTRTQTICIDCGCTTDNACIDGCSWIWAKDNDGLCSKCEEKFLAEIE